MGENSEKHHSKHERKEHKHIEPEKKDHKLIGNKRYEKELKKLEYELVKLQEWVKHKQLKVAVLFEGRDAAGKGGVIKRIMGPLNPRICRIAALGTPTEKEKSEWYFQRYAKHLPSAGEIVLFDHSWYNRAAVEYVMGFCTEEQYQEFFKSCPEFEQMLMRSGIILIKYWFSVSDEEQEIRFQDRLKDPTKRWKLSPKDIVSREKLVEYSETKDEMFKHTDLDQSPWYVVPADNQKLARLNCISHLLSLIEYGELPYEPIAFPPRKEHPTYLRPPITDQTFVPDRYSRKKEDPESDLE